MRSPDHHRSSFPPSSPPAHSSAAAARTAQAPSAAPPPRRARTRAGSEREEERHKVLLLLFREIQPVFVSRDLPEPRSREEIRERPDRAVVEVQPREIESPQRRHAVPQREFLTGAGG